MTLQELNNELTKALKSYIKSTHYKSGALYNSIKFNCTDKDGLKIKFNSMEYIYELDNGNFVNNFFELDSTINIITEYLSDTLIVITPTKSSS